MATQNNFVFRRIVIIDEDIKQGLHCRILLRFCVNWNLGRLSPPIEMKLRKFGNCKMNSTRVQYIWWSTSSPGHLEQLTPFSTVLHSVFLTQRSRWPLWDSGSSNGVLMCDLSIVTSALSWTSLVITTLCFDAALCSKFCQARIHQCHDAEKYWTEEVEVIFHMLLPYM